MLKTHSWGIDHWEVQKRISKLKSILLANFGIVFQYWLCTLVLLTEPNKSYLHSSTLKAPKAASLSRGILTNSKRTLYRLCKTNFTIQGER